jgi:hypothetical protein
MASDERACCLRAVSEYTRVRNSYSPGQLAERWKGFSQTTFMASAEAGEDGSSLRCCAAVLISPAWMPGLDYFSHSTSGQGFP